MYPLGPWGFAQVLNQTLSNTIPGGYSQKNWVGDVRPASQNPYPIYDQNLRLIFSLIPTPPPPPPREYHVDVEQSYSDNVLTARNKKGTYNKIPPM